MYDNKHVSFSYFGFTKPCVHSIAFHSASIDSSLRISPKGGYASFTKHRSPFARYASSIAPLLLLDGGTCVLSHFNPFASKYSRCVSTMTSRFVVCENEFVCPL